MLSASVGTPATTKIFTETRIVIDIYRIYVYIPTCCAPLTLGHKNKVSTVSCGYGTKPKRSSNNLWQQKKQLRSPLLNPPRRNRLVHRRVAQRRVPKVELKKAEPKRAPPRALQKVARRSNSNLRSKTLTFHRRTQHTTASLNDGLSYGTATCFQQATRRSFSLSLP